MVQMGTFQQTVLLLMLTVSGVLQFYAAFLALRILRLTHRNRAWLLIAAAIVLMALRRVIVVYHLMTGGASHAPDFYAETAGFIISLLLAAGLFLITPLMRRLYDGSPDTDGGFAEPDSFNELFEQITTGIAVYEAVDRGRDFIIRRH